VPNQALARSQIGNDNGPLLRALLGVVVGGGLGAIPGVAACLLARMRVECDDTPWWTPEASTKWAGAMGESRGEWAVTKRYSRQQFFRDARRFAFCLLVGPPVFLLGLVLADGLFGGFRWRRLLWWCIWH
jgi:hypothetical protein